MKKLTSAILSALVCASVLAPTVYAADRHSEVFEIAYGTPEMDLVLDDCYKNSTEVTFNTDMGDANGSVYFTWDEKNLYFYVHIDDSTPCTESAKNGTDHNTDSIEICTSFYGFDPTADSLTAKDVNDIGDAQFRVFRTKEFYDNTDLTTNGLDSMYCGGYAFYTDLEESSFVIHDGGTETGYTFEGYVAWGEELQTSDKPIGEGSVIGIGLQINDDTNDDGARDKKIYSINSDPTKSMSTDRATCGAFQLVKASAEAPVEETEAETIAEPETEAETTAPETAETVEETVPAVEEPVAEPETVTEEVEAPQTFDGGLILAVTAVLSAYGYTKCKKH